MKRIGKVCFLLGCVMILFSLALLGYSQFHARMAGRKAAAISETIQDILTVRTTGIMDSYSCMEMPVLQIEDQDFCGLLEIPGYGITLPIYDTWDAAKTNCYPCRFWGSTYDGSLIVGGSDQTGQFDMLDQIQNGCVVSVLDMTGAEFDYTVSWVQRSKEASAQALLEEGWDLTLFARDSTSMDYIIVRCTVS